jgi:hypothetical protein
MQNRKMLVFLLAVGLTWGTAALAGGEHNGANVAAHVFCSAASPTAVGSARYQVSLSVAQWGVVGSQGGSTRDLELGFQAAAGGLDSDYDGVADGDDLDSDGDGIADSEDVRPYDTDNDGLNNLVQDDDDDGEGLEDSEEWPFGTSLVIRDTDGDGFDDLAEWIAGTGGTDPDDCFRISGMLAAQAAVDIEWLGVAGRRYEILGIADLLSTGEWSVVGETNVTVSGPVVLTDMSPSGQGFYKARVSLWPF